MSQIVDRLPVSRPNALLLAVLVAGLVATLLLGLWPQAVVMALLLLVIGVSAWVGRRESASDVTRVDSLEYRDERDRAIARDGFAVVGVLALVITVVESVLVGVLAPEWVFPVLVRLVILCAAWAIGNRVAARRL